MLSVDNLFVFRLEQLHAASATPSRAWKSHVWKEHLPDLSHSEQPQVAWLRAAVFVPCVIRGAVAKFVAHK